MSHGGHEFNEELEGDVGPGTMSLPHSTVREGVLGYVFGLAAASLLTVASFYVAGTSVIWGPSIPMALVVLAVAQIGVHLVFFLHLTSAPDNTNNILALAFGVLIVALIVGGSIWIMQHLNQNMMPMSQKMEMQR
jgi:cytochrome o ubiquinol oxidase operon protein cyoD